MSDSDELDDFVRAINRSVVETVVEILTPELSDENRVALNEWAELNGQISS
jgi:hypothetical protein